MGINNRMTYVLGVDPGTTTGVALLRLDHAQSGFPTAVGSDQLSWDDAGDLIAGTLERMRAYRDDDQAVAVAVAEKFQVNARTHQMGQQGAEDALGMIGVLRREARLTGVELADAQQASAAKSMVTDRALKMMALYAPGLSHVNDAYRHAVLLAVKRKYMPPEWLIKELEQ